MARLLIGVSGGIAAYKAIETARLAIKAGHSVRVIQTQTSQRFVGRASFEGITGAPVLVTEFDRDPMRGAFPGEPLPQRAPISHLALVERAELYLIAPASANTIARLAHGHADNLVCTAALAAACPVAIAPAMNNRMYLHAATQENLRLLAAHGVSIIPPGEGELASHAEHGIGRLAEPAELLDACQRLLAGGLHERAWAGTRVLVSAGGTREPIDSVRFIGNRSSGRMGFALAAAALSRGAQVTVIAANVAIDPPRGARIVRVRSAAELNDACAAEFAACDVLLMAAAVADFRPAAPAADKLKRDGGPPPPIEVVPTRDVLAELTRARRADQLMVGFAAEHGAGALENARAKLERKGLDAIVVNDISRQDVGFDVAENEVVILSGRGERRVPRADKRAVAEIVLDEVQQLRPQKEGLSGAARAAAGSATGV